MAVLDFPASPAIGDKYPTPAVAGQPQYTWDGEKWTTVGAQVTTAAPASALPLMDAATAVVGTATKYAREDHVHPKIAAAPMDALAYSGMQVNGSMEVSQERGVGTPVAVPNNSPGVYVVDGWYVGTNGTHRVTGQQNAFAPAGFTTAVQVYTTTANPSPGASDYCILGQSIEGYRVARLSWGTAAAQPITLGFWVFAGKAGLFSGAVQNSATDRAYVFTFNVNVAQTLEYKTITVPGDTTGTWNKGNTTGMRITFTYLSGSTFLTATSGSWLAGNYIGVPGIANNAATTSDTMLVTGVVVLPGTEAPSAARSALIMRPYDQELLTCQRYWQKTQVMNRFNATGAGNVHDVTGKFSHSFRAVPTTLVLTAGSRNNASSAAVDAADINGTFRHTLTSAAAGDCYALSDVITGDARL
jgi:hypothetical protein